MTPSDRCSVLVTGSSGNVGRVVVEALRAAGHRVRGFDRVAHPTLDDQIIAELTDRPAVQRAVAGMDQVIHLAAHPHAAPFVEVLVPSNVVGLYHVAMSAVEAGVKRLILASTIQVIGIRAGDAGQPVSADFAAPENDYALTKLWAEQLGRMVAHKYGVEVLAVRIGWLVRNAEESQNLHDFPHRQAIYLSRSDAARFFLRAVETPRLDAPGNYATLYAVGCGNDGVPPVDLDTAHRLIGYEPRVSWPDEAPLS